ncbi:hypothetical protein HK105_207284 [Polyrhizophydium stewartii]|uniref:Uncharacterized protein n=1 Tax=Polyrhizophydium stewartii TaxID=2732419 RepID=A0ABR4N0Z4_9FUNG|nr:hypothetical protein HK105_005352 [Polyrhizophydium stewartii]
MSFLRGLFGQRAGGPAAVAASAAAAAAAAAAASEAAAAAAGPSAAAAYGAAAAKGTGIDVRSLLPSQAFVQRILDVNELWLREFLRPRAHAQHPRSRVHVLGTSFVNIPRLAPVPFSHNKRLVMDSEKAFEQLAESYQDTDGLGGGDMAAGGSRAGCVVRRGPAVQIAVLVDETPDRGAWLTEEYGPLLATCRMGGEAFVGDQEYTDIMSFFRAPQTVGERLDQVAAWAHSNQGSLLALDAPHDWVPILQRTGLMPAVDTVAFFNSVLAFRRQHAEDPVMREISPQLASLDLVGLEPEVLEHVVDSMADGDDKSSGGAAAGSDGSDGIASRLAAVYADCGVAPETFGQIQSGFMQVDGALQRLALDSGGVLRFVDAVLEAGRGGAGGVLGSPVGRRVAEMAASAAHLDHAVAQHLARSPDDVVVVVADRPVAAILQSRLQA